MSDLLPRHRDRADACPGALRVHQAADGGLARVRVPGGALSRDRWAALAAASRHGTGGWELTSRGNVQLRGIRPGATAALAADLAAAGLLPSRTHETVRNIVVSPLTGRCPGGHTDLRGYAARLDAALCADPRLADLPGRFLFALDDGRGDVRALGADVTAFAVGPGRVAVLLAGHDLGLRVAPDDQVPAVLAAARAFCAERRAQGSRAWRLTELDDGPARVAAVLRADPTATGVRPGAALRADPAATGTPLDGTAHVPAADPAPIGSPLRPAAADGVPVGLLPQVDGRVALSVLAPLGRLTPEQLTLLGDLARADLIVTPWRGVLLPDLDPAAATDALRRAGRAGLVTDQASPWAGVTACAGRPGCAKSHTDVRADAAAATRARTAADAPAVVEADHAGPCGGLLPVHWVGCERRCGQPSAAVQVRATASGYLITAPGEPPRPAGPDLAAAIRTARTAGDRRAEGPQR